MASLPFTTHYDNLKVSPDASPEAIRRAYMTLVALHHPGRSEDKERSRRQLQMINAAFDVLDDPQQRRAYDVWLHRVTDRSSSAPEPPPLPEVRRLPPPVPLAKEPPPLPAPSTPAAAPQSLPAVKETRRKLPKALLIVLAVVLLAGATAAMYFFFQQGVGSFWKTEPTRNTVFDPPPSLVRLKSVASDSQPIPKKEQPLPEHGYITHAEDAELVAPLELVTQPGLNYFFKLCDPTTGEDIMTIFIRGGEPFETNVPLGTFVLKYASGEKWYGEEFLFGPDTSCAKFESEVKFFVDEDPSEKKAWNAAKKRVLEYERQIGDFLKDQGIKKDTIRLIWEETETPSGVSRMDRFSEEWWDKNVLSQLNSKRDRKAMLDILLAWYAAKKKLLDVEEKYLFYSGHTFTLNEDAKGDDINTMRIAAEEF